ncbi:MAG: S8 family serine peptidase [Bacteroidota bacterium]
MKRNFYLLLCICCFAGNVVAQKPDLLHASNQLIVKFTSEPLDRQQAKPAASQLGGEALHVLNQQYGLSSYRLIGNRKLRQTYVLRFERPGQIEQMVKEYHQTGQFDYVEPNFIGQGCGRRGLLQTIPNDRYFSRQYGLLNDGSFRLSTAVEDADIDMDLAWDIEKGSSEMIIAVLDSGIRLQHPEFEGRLWNNLIESSDGIDEDENGYIDDVEGWDFANEDNLPQDDHGHGTNVTGIVGARSDNDLGYAGVDWNAQIMPIKILNEDNWGLYSWWTEGIYYAVDNGAKVLNMSVGGTSFSSSMREATEYAHDNGVIIVASAGNADSDEVQYPSGYEHTIAVGSTNADDTRTSPFFWSQTSGSNYGDHIDVVAPGNFIYGLNYSSNVNYNTYWGGTSQASPLVAGLCALLLAQDPSRTPDEVRDIIHRTAVDQVGDPMEDTEGYDIYYGHGRINAHQALLQMVSTSTSQIAVEEDIQLFPNPSKGQITISMGGLRGDVSMIDLVGRVHFQESQRQGQFDLDLSVYPPGVYFLRFSLEGQQEVVLKKLIVQ